MNKVARAQLGTGLHQVWMQDIIKHCGAKALFVCDFAHGVGEVMKAAAKCKVAEPATTAKVRVCMWGQDPRKIFAEIGRAVGRTELSNLFMDKKLVVPGHQPIPDPGPLPERTHKFIKALLQKPLRTLSLNSDGYLIIPTKEEIARACPVSLNAEQDNQFESWRSEFPRDAPAPAVGTTEAVEANGNGVGNSPNIGPGSATPLAPGTKADSEGDLKTKFGDEILCQKICPIMVPLLLLSVG